jgi:roadblock/LC7 domain-containing protein
VVRFDPPNTTHIWLIELGRGVPSRLTSGPAMDYTPIWSPDGSRIAFESNREGVFNIYQKHASSAGNDEELLKSDKNKAVSDWSPDGRFILYGIQREQSSFEEWVLPLFGDRKPFPLLQNELTDIVRFSPDGRWVAYESAETGKKELYVREFQGSGGRWQVSAGGGNWAGWRQDSKELFYLSAGKLMAVEVKADGSAFELGEPKLLFENQMVGDFSFDVSGNGQLFLIPAPVEESSSAPITVVMNWTADLKR